MGLENGREDGRNSMRDTACCASRIYLEFFKYFLCINFVYGFLIVVP